MKPLKITCLGHELNLCSDDEVPEGEDPRDHVYDRNLLSWYEAAGSSATGFDVYVSFEYYEEGGEHEGMWTVHASLSSNGRVEVDGRGHSLERAESDVVKALKEKVSLHSSLLAMVEGAPHLEIDTNPPKL